MISRKPSNKILSQVSARGMINELIIASTILTANHLFYRADAISLCKLILLHNEWLLRSTISVAISLIM